MENSNLNIVKKDKEKNQLDMIEELKILRKNIEYYEKCLSSKEILDAEMEYIEALKLRSESRINEIIEDISHMEKKENHSISEIFDLISDRKIEDVNKVTKEIYDTVLEKNEEKENYTDR